MTEASPIFDQLASPQEDTVTDTGAAPAPLTGAQAAMAAAAVPAAATITSTTAEISAAPDTASHLRTMVDSAYPLHNPPSPVPDIVLIYAGGDTVHPWTPAEIAAMPERFRWPCWVRSNPQEHDPAVDAAQFAHWLAAHAVPKGTSVILDLETAVSAVFVNAFNLAMRAAGYLVAKYGSQSTIWDNPKTSGGTYLALPGPAELTGEGDEIARQYAFDGDHDLSVVDAQDVVPLWDMRPPRKPYLHHADGTRSLDRIAKDRGTTEAHLVTVSRAGLHGNDLDRFEAYLAGKMAAGTPYCTTNP